MASVSSLSLSSGSEKRALVIGNNSYSEGESLRYCVNNVHDVHDKLSTIHFQVTVGIDLKCEQMDSMIEDFRRDICVGDLVVFFFSGYGRNWKGENYLIPVDDDQILTPEMLKDQSVNVQSILEMIMDRSPNAAVFMLDCCRPYLIRNKSASRLSIGFSGLSSIQPFPGSLIAFACDAEKVTIDKSKNGRNDIFTSHLLGYIDQSNLPIEEMMDLICEGIMAETNDEQCPFRVNALRKNVYLNYQIPSGFNQQRNGRLEKMIIQSPIRSLVDLRKQELTDRDMKIVVEQIIVNKECTRLWLGENEITSVGASILASALQNNKTLERLYLYDNCISDMGVKALSNVLSMNKTNIEILGLQQNQITDLGVQYISQMIKTNEMLTSLWLNDNEISDIGVKLLSDALDYSKTNLHYLDLSKNKFITDLSVNYFEHMIKHNRSLNELSIYQCNLSQMGKERIQKEAKLKKNFCVYVNTWNN